MATSASGHVSSAGVFCLILSLFVVAWADNDDHGSEKNIYDTEMFTAAVESKPHFIMFFAPWCGHCKRLAPTWDELADVYNNDDSNEIYVAKVDCTAQTKLCKEQGVTGYPTLKFFKPGEEATRYKGKRDLEALKAHIQESMGAPAEKPQPPEAKHGLYELTEDSFKDHIEKGNHFVKFYAPWCGHCKKLAPTWDQLAEGFEHTEDVTICKVDCTAHKKVCDQFGVRGYPTLKWFKNGEMVDDYKQARQYDNLKKYVTKMIGQAEEKKEEEPAADSKVVVLTADSFEEATAKGLAFVKFYAPWCPHCKKIAPVWEELATKVEGKSGVTIADVDCTEHKDLCSKHEVKGYPTLLMFKNGALLEKYSKGRDVDALNAYVNNKLRDEL